MVKVNKSANGVNTPFGVKGCFFLPLWRGSGGWFCLWKKGGKTPQKSPLNATQDQLNIGRKDKGRLKIGCCRFLVTARTMIVISGTRN